MWASRSSTHPDFTASVSVPLTSTMPLLTSPLIVPPTVYD